MNPPRPIFIIGAPRSGTSITTWVLGQHPNIQPMPETAWISSMAVGAYLSHAKGSARGRLSHLSNVDFPRQSFMARIGEAIDAIVHDAYGARLRQMYGGGSDDPAWRVPERFAHLPLQIRRAGNDPKQRWVDGTPLNTHYLWALSELFPEARFIHNLRRPEEVATSLQAFDRLGAEPQALEDGLETWIAHTENAWYGERAFGRDRVFRLDFRRIADEPDALFREVCAFLGEEYTSDCLIPLRKKLNSSEADDRREENLRVLQESPTFQRARILYDVVFAQPAAEPEPFAQDVVRQRFLDYCVDRSLV